jgi:hypothetical protein
MVITSQRVEPVVERKARRRPKGASWTNVDTTAWTVELSFVERRERR